MDLDIIEQLLKREHHIRDIAHQLHESHSTILRKLNKLKKEHVVDARKEGKNKVFFIKENIISRTYIFQTELYKSIKLFRTYPELSVIFDEILQTTDAPLIILFGSYAKGLAKKHSDIDIYIETKNKNIKKIIESIHSNINVKIGPFDTRSLLIQEIIKHHIIIRGVERFYAKK